MARNHLGLALATGRLLPYEPGTAKIGRMAVLASQRGSGVGRQVLDALMAAATLRRAFRTDVEPILAMARLRKGAAIDPVAAYRASGYRGRVAAARPRVLGGGGGIV